MNAQQVVGSWLSATTTSLNHVCGTMARRISSLAPGTTPDEVSTVVEILVVTSLLDNAILSPHPNRPTQTVTDTVSASPVPTLRTYVVARNDSLWSIAKHDLPFGTDGLTIMRAALAIWMLNTTRIGPDPNLIFAGTVLTLPR